MHNVLIFNWHDLCHLCSSLFSVVHMFLYIIPPSRSLSICQQTRKGFSLVSSYHKSTNSTVCSSKSPHMRSGTFGRSNFPKKSRHPRESEFSLHLFVEVHTKQRMFPPATGEAIIERLSSACGREREEIRAIITAVSVGWCDAWKKTEFWLVNYKNKKNPICVFEIVVFQTHLICISILKIFFWI